MGFQQSAAVGHGRYRGDHLQRGQREVLTEGINRKVNIGIEVEQTHRLTGQINAGFIPETEGLYVFCKGGTTHTQADVHNGGVTGVFQHVPQVLGTVTHALPAIDGLVPTIHLQRTGTVELAAGGDNVLLQCGSGGDDLEGRAGIVQEGYRLVAPLLINSFRSGRRPLFIVCNGVDFSLHRLGQLKGFIGIKIGIRGHGKNAAVVYIHDETDGRALHLIVVIGDLQIFLQKMLQHLVDGQHQ